MRYSLRLGFLAALLAAVFVLPPVAQSTVASPLALDVNYSYSGAITVTLPDGTPVGTTSGTPTVIPAGYYIVTLTQPGCVDTPAFVLQGPGVSIVDDLQSGEEVSDSDGASFQPNATYTWRDGSLNPPVYHTFATSGSVVGTPPAATTPAAVDTGSNTSESNSGVVGSAAASSSSATLRGTLSGRVASSGTITLTYRGKRVTELTAGRYTLSVSDASRDAGFVLEQGGHLALTVSSRGFSGTRTKTVVLKPGQWAYASSPHATSFGFVVTS